MKTRREGSWHVHFVSWDSLLTERVLAYLSKRSGRFAFTHSEAPRAEADVNILPIDMFPSNAESAIIAYGDALHIRRAFLAGSQDYLKNPWSPDELLIRLEHLLGDWDRHCEFRWGRLELTGYRITAGGHEVLLSHQENSILRQLLRHRGSPVSREVLFYRLWGSPPQYPSRVVDVHVSSLNRKIRSLLPADDDIAVIVSVRRVGYMIRR